jgi:Zn-dependent protease
MEFLLFLPVLLFSVVLHEYAHGWAALREGDATAYMLGRLTLNPIPHIDPIGSVLVPLILFIMPGGLIFGWARPVPVNPRNYRNYRRGDIIVSLAGVTANLLLAAAFTLLTVLLVHGHRLLPGLAPSFELLVQMASFGVLINLILIFFNLIPIPPLDGSHVLYHLLPPRLGAAYRELGRYGFFVLIALIFFIPGGLRFFLWPALVLHSFAQSLVRLWT